LIDLCLILYSLFIEDIMIYDEEADKLVHIEFEQALRACCIDPDDEAKDIETLLGGPQNDADGTPVTAIERLIKSAEEHTANITDATTKAAFKQLIDGKGKGPLSSAADGEGGGRAASVSGASSGAAAPAAAPLSTVAGIVAAVKAGICLKICITIARPFIEHHMLSAVAAVSGRDTGATLYGPADMQISANTSVKTIEGACNAHRTSSLSANHAFAHPFVCLTMLLRFLIACRPLHLLHQVGHHQAAERHGAARHHVQRLRCGWQLPLLWHGRQEDHCRQPAQIG